MGCFASKGAGPGAYEVSKLADAFEDRKSVDGAENSVTEGDQGGPLDGSPCFTPLFDGDFRFSRTVQGKKLVSKVTQSKSAPLEHVLAAGRDEDNGRPSTSDDDMEGKEYLVEVLKSKYFFAHLREGMFQELVGMAEQHSCEAEDTLYRSGDETDSVFLMESGSFFCLMANDQGSFSAKQGDLLVSMEEVRSRGRNGTMTSVSGGVYWTLDIKTFKKACRVFMDSLDYRFLTQVDYFLYLGEDHLLESSFHMHVINVPRGKGLSHYVDTGKHLYVLRKGSISDTTTDRVISSHQVFAESDIFSQETSVSNYKCLEKALVLQLPEAKYDRYLGLGLMGIFEDKIKIQIVQEVARIKKVHGNRVEDIFQLFEEKVFTSGTALAMPNESLDSTVILKKGTLVQVEEKHGKMTSIGKLEPYAVFGLQAMIRNKKPPTGICVKSETATCIVLSKEKLTQLTQDDGLRRNSSFIKDAPRKKRNSAKSIKNKTKAKVKTKKKKNGNYSLGDFRPMRLLGQGQFGVVLQMQHIKSNKIFALKVQYRREIEELGQVERVRQERLALGRLDHPNICKFVASFKDEKAVYLLMEAARGGELFYHLEASAAKRFDEHTACFIAASVLGALQHIHQCGLIYRDLKPENILLDSKGYPKLVDFGCAKIAEDSNLTMCGTPEYVPPELIQGLGYDYRSDYWQYGILLFEMLCGFTPFEPGFCADHATKARLIYERILMGRVDFPRHVSQEARDLIKKLLVLDPDQRLDGRLDETARAIETHPWFGYHKMTVAGVAKKKISPCLMPASENSFQPNMGGINFTRIPQPNTTSTNVLDDVY